MEGLNPGDRVKLFFDDKGRVQAAVLRIPLLTSMSLFLPALTQDAIE